MRWSWLVGVVGGAAAVSATVSCNRFYGYCSGQRIMQVSPVWRTPTESPLRIPVDAAPWLLRDCDSRNAPVGCQLTVDGERFPVLVELEGDDACELSYGEQIGNFPVVVVQTLHPSRPLPVNGFVELDCGFEAPDDTGGYYYYSPPDDYVDYSYGYYFSRDNYGPEPPLTGRVKADDKPAAVPETPDGLQLRFVRDDPDASCFGDVLEVKMDFTADYLQEGGYIEVKYPNGQVYVFSRPREDGAAILPGSLGPLELTPVSISGERGDTLRVDEADIRDGAVYIPSCAVDPARPAGGPVALLAFTWLALVRRRRTEEQPR